MQAIESARLRIREAAADDLPGLLPTYLSNPEYFALNEGAQGEPGYFDLEMLQRDWWVAMMLPSSMPLIKMVIFASRRQRQARPVAIQAAFLAGYAVIWTAFALVAFLGDTGIHHAVDIWPWLAAHRFVIGSVTFAIAGAFQFSLLKERCLSACRTPLGFFTRHYREGVAPAWRLGLRHGLFCLGCCWALMLVMFGVGVGSLAWMAGLAGVMVIERAIPGGRRFVPFVGVALLVLAVIWCLYPAWLVPAAAS